MMFATPTAPTSSATAPSPRKSPFSAAFASACATRAAEGWVTSTSFGDSGFAVAARTAVDRRRLGRRLDPQVDLGGMAVEVQVLLRGREADEHLGVDLGRERRRVQDARDVEPHVVEPDPFAGIDAVDAETLRRCGAEDADRLGRGRGVQVLALGDRGPDGTGRPRLAASTLSAFVSIEGMSGLRKTFASDRPGVLHVARPGRSDRSSPGRPSAARRSGRRGSGRSSR